MRRGVARRPAAQHHLVAHELAVVFADRAGGGAITGIGRVGATRPLPCIAEHLRKAASVAARDVGPIAARLHEIADDGAITRRALPLSLARQTLAPPARVGLGLVESHV